MLSLFAELAVVNPIGGASRSRFVASKDEVARRCGESETSIPLKILPNPVEVHKKGLRAQFLGLGACFFIVKL